MITMNVTLAPSASAVKVSSKRDGGRVQLSFPGHERDAVMALVKEGRGRSLACKMTVGESEIAFTATLAPIGAAIRFAGEPDDEDDGRINLELPQTEISALLAIAAYCPGHTFFLDIVPGEMVQDR